MKIYVVEDSDAIYDRIIRLLKEVEDSNVVGAADDELGAIRGIENSAPDVVITDINLLHGSGLNVLRHVKAVMPDVKVVLLTNFHSDQYRAVAESYGVDAFLDKSFDFLQIPQLLRAWQPSLDTVPN